MRSLIQTPPAGKEDTPKVQGESPAAVSSFLKLCIYLSVCQSAYLKILPKAKLENDLHDAWFDV